MTNLGTTIGNSVKELRGETSQNDFAEFLGIALRTYQRYESGERLFPDDALDKITKRYNLELVDLFKNSGIKKEFTAPPSNTVTLKKILSIPDEIYEMADKMDKEAWDTVAGTMEGELNRIQGNEKFSS
jgi:transcriptional regulator with XRE-family HTH domain